MSRGWVQYGGKGFDGYLFATASIAVEDGCRADGMAVDVGLLVGDGSREI